MYLCAFSPTLPFADAARIYLSLRSVDAASSAAGARYISARTLADYEQYARTLVLFFGTAPLESIGYEAMRAYQEARIEGVKPFIRLRRPQDGKPRMVNGVLIPAKGPTPCPARPKKIKQELNFLIALMRRARCWTDADSDIFEHLQIAEPEIPRALTPEEQQRWLEVAASRERWQVAHWYSIVAFHTTASPNELHLLRVGDVNIQYQTISVPWPAAKTRGRHRSIPIESADCLWALERMLERAKELGAKDPRHHLMPGRDRRTNEYDPTRPMSCSGLKRAWNEIRAASDLKWFRLEDTRHTGATRLAEMGVSSAIIAERMGHCNLRMQKHYEHISQSAHRAWVRNPQAEFMRQHPQPPPGWQPPTQMPPSYAVPMRPQPVPYPQPGQGPGEWRIVRGRYRWCPEPPSFGVR